MSYFGIDPEPDPQLASRCVDPFYLKMMSCNALKNGPSLLPEIALVADTSRPDEVISLLRGPWRPRVMGAWLAVRKSDSGVRNAVLESLQTSLGTLTAPPLTVVAVTLAGGGAMPALINYHASDVENKFGAAWLVEAAAAYVSETYGLPDDLPRPSPRDAETFDRLLDIAQTLQVM